MIKPPIFLFRSFTNLNLYRMSNFNKKPNLYTLLQLKPGAKQEEITYNYYKLIRQYHPDMASDAIAHSKMLNEAYAILSNQILKKRYDHEQGYDVISSQTTKKNKGEEFNKKQDIEQRYTEAKKGFSAVSADKNTRMQQILLASVAGLVFIATLLLLFGGGSSKKRSNPNLNYSSEMSKQQFQASFKQRLKSGDS